MIDLFNNQLIIYIYHLFIFHRKQTLFDLFVAILNQIAESQALCTFASARESTSFKNGYAFLYIAGVLRSIFFDASYSRILSPSI